MTRIELIQEIYILTCPNNPLGAVINLNINRGKYIISKLWNVDGEIIAFLYNDKENIQSYVDELKITDQIFIYRKLLKMDIYYNMVESYPDKDLYEIVSLTDNIFAKLTKHKRKIVHSKFLI